MSIIGIIESDVRNTNLNSYAGPVIEMARTIAYWRSNAVAASKVVNEISIHQIKDIGKSARL